MIIEDKIYYVECDCCHTTMDFSNRFPILRASDAEEIARDDGWFINENGHYCPNCWHYDDNCNIITDD